MPLFTLPPIHTLFYAELRERFERRVDKDFDSSIADNRSDLFTRLRLGAKLSLGKNWRGEIQFQVAHDAGWTKARNFSVENRDLGLAYVETNRSGWTVEAGRQKINIGQQRLIGSFDWNNVGRSFDAVRVRSKAWDAFAFKIGVASPKPRDARVAGLVHMSPACGDSLAVFKHDKGVDITTLGHSVSRVFGTIALDAEGAIQFGRSGGKDQRAWAVHLRGQTKVGPIAKAYAEIDAASGGSSASESRTFDNLYPTNHGKYGIADMIAWKNMNHAAAGIELAPRKDVVARLSWNFYSLRDSRDAWYGAGGAPNTHGGAPLKDPTGASGRDLGNEIDFDSTWTVNKTSALSGGLAVFSPGRFVRKGTGHDDRQFWGYLQFGIRF